MNNNIISEILQKSKDNKEIVSIWKYSDADNFWSGYVNDYNEDLVMIQHFTKYGKPDGVIIENILDIKCIDFNDEYSKAMQCLIDYSSELDKDNSPEIKLTLNQDWQYEVLKQVENHKDIIVRIEVSGDDYSGFIKRVETSDFIIDCIGHLGQDEGSVVYKLDDVTSIRVNDIDLRKRLMLYKWRKTRI